MGGRVRPSIAAETLSGPYKVRGEASCRSNCTTETISRNSSGRLSDGSSGAPPSRSSPATKPPSGHAVHESRKTCQESARGHRVPARGGRKDSAQGSRAAEIRSRGAVAPSRQRGNHRRAGSSSPQISEATTRTHLCHPAPRARRCPGSTGSTGATQQRRRDVAARLKKATKAAKAWTIPSIDWSDAISVPDGLVPPEPEGHGPRSLDRPIGGAASLAQGAEDALVSAASDEAVGKR